MSQNKSLQEALESIANLPAENIKVHAEYRIAHMTPETAQAAIESTRNQFAIPAQEQTRQAEQRTAQVHEETKRHYASTALVGLVAVGVLVLIGKSVWDGKAPDMGSLLFLLALVLVQRAGPAALDLLKDWMQGTAKPT